MPQPKGEENQFSLERKFAASGISKPALRVSYAIILIIFLLGIGAAVVHSTEGWNWLDSFYFATTSLTTVGYGDFVPHHERTRLFLIFYLLFGVATLLYAITNIARYYIEQREERFERTVLRLRNAGEKASNHLSKIPHPPTSKRRS